MGADYWSIAVAGEAHEAVEEAVASWLARKGYEEVPADELSFEIDREIERAFFLAWDERWTIVLYSEFLVDPTGRFRIRLAEAALIQQPPFGPRGLAFRAGRLDVRGSGVHGRIARGAITHGGGALLYEADFDIGGLPAKAVGWRQEGEKGRVAETHCVYVQTPWLVYQFDGRAEGSPTQEDLADMRSVIETFEVVPAGA